MAHFPKALLHHGKAGKALKAGDSKLAAHHLGHAMSALRASATGDETEKPYSPPFRSQSAPIPDAAPETPQAPPQPSKLRGMLSRFRASGGAV